MSEHVGQIISSYFYEIADSEFRSFPDGGGMTKDGKSNVSYHYLSGGVRLTTIRTGSVETMYMRFRGLAQSIGRAELARLGVHPHEDYPDLVIACEGSRSNHFTIVPNESRHHVRRLRCIQVPMGATRPPLLDEGDPWLRLEPGRYHAGIYESGTVDISGKLPATTEACLSVARLLVARDSALRDLVQDPGDPSS